MSKLPFTIEDLLSRPFTPDTTLGELKIYMSQREVAHRFGLDLIRPDWVSVRVDVRFLRVPGGEELPDDMTIGEFRPLANFGQASISIGIGDGGVRVLEPA